MSDPTPIRTLGGLADRGLVAEQATPELEAVAARYAIGITQAMASLIDPLDPHDPIARQFVPDLAELNRLPSESSDPIGDAAHSPVEGIVHRYPDRVLLKLTLLCAVYCRFCFRREFVGAKGAKSLNTAGLDAALAYIANKPEIWEVILTGGDPLVLSPRRLGAVMARLAQIDHVKIIRVHTRMPVVAPDAISDAMIKALHCSGKAVYVALHANHARELTPSARAACARIIDAGLPMLSQTVLLRGVNDDVETLGALMRAFVEARIKPYYLHQGDLAPGTSHFRVPIAEGQALVRALRGTLSGLCQPTYILDVPDGHGKVPIGPTYLEARDFGWSVEDPNGHRHSYPTGSDEAPA